MKNFIIKIAIITMLVSIFSPSFAQMVETQDRYLGEKKNISITGFVNYPPFGYMEKNIYKSAFDGFWESYEKRYGFNGSRYHSKDYKNSIIDVRMGKVDFIFGMYNQTNIYNGIEYIYPAAINNPIHLVIMPENASRIKNLQDVKGFKGAIHIDEPISDYIKKYLKSLDVITVNSSDEIFKLLFTGKIDYIIGGKYFYMVESAKIGINKQIVYSKEPIWNMPVFFGVSKPYKHRALLVRSLSEILKTDAAKEKINNYLIQTIHNIEMQNSGVVPPDFANN